ncbi:MAG: trypsin-like peptidase domain-containing protein [Microcoleus sp. SU_5_3]|nr:trypsin-like peptidase domain-containing protein [Microcoleus sp. SU_5_3]
MNFGVSRFNYVPAIVAGTATVAAIVISQPVMAKTAKEVAQIAVPTTVQINNALSPGDSGSGVIIAKKGKTYTVLTANHVVKNPNNEYTIRTSKGKEHKVTDVKGFRNNESGPDLAIAMFESDEEYSVAPISNSDEATIGSGVYISGYPLPAGVGSQEREYQFTNGQVTNVRSSNDQGYTMRYAAVTRRGMSGGPVFDVSGRVIGIHGQGDTDGIVAVQNESGQNTGEAKTGFNSAIPINTFVGMLSQVGMEKSAFKIDNKPPANVDAEKVEDGEAKGWFADFGKEVVKDVIQRGLRRILPF